MAKRKVIDVKPNQQDGGWDVTERGGRTISHHTLKGPAVLRAGREVKAAGVGHVVVRKGDGSIQIEYTYHEDPRIRRK